MPREDAPFNQSSQIPFIFIRRVTRINRQGGVYGR